MGSRTPSFSRQPCGAGLRPAFQPPPEGSPEACTTPLLPADEGGFTLAALIVILTIISIIVAYTVPPQWSLIMHRERDKQTIFQMKQAARAIAIWQAKHQGFPNSLEQLKEAKEPRVIRVTGGEEGGFLMPLTGKEEDWILVPEAALEPVAQPPVPPGQPAPPLPPSKLREGASPPEYEGPFIGVRPNKSGKSILALNGEEDYSKWVYTTRDLNNEIRARIAAINVK
jgi:competence protein ComGC